MKDCWFSCNVKRDQALFSRWRSSQDVPDRGTDGELDGSATLTRGIGTRVTDSTGRQKASLPALRARGGLATDMAAPHQLQVGCERDSRGQKKKKPHFSPRKVLPPGHSIHDMLQICRYALSRLIRCTGMSIPHQEARYSREAQRRERCPSTSLDGGTLIAAGPADLGLRRIMRHDGSGAEGEWWDPAADRCGGDGT